MDEAKKKAVGLALGRIPSGLFVLTAQHEDQRMGVLTGWVQQVCFRPPMVSVAVAKGLAIMPLISESRRFGLCQVGEEDKVIARKFSSGVDSREDPFLGLELRRGDASSRVPILAHSVAYLECELTCHMDVEGDHDLFIGTVMAGHATNGSPRIHLRDDGFRY